MTSGDDGPEPAAGPQPEDGTAEADVPRHDGETDVRKRAAERRRLAEVFGDVLPESTTDDAADPADARDVEGRDADILRDVPPHH